MLLNPIHSKRFVGQIKNSDYHATKSNKVNAPIIDEFPLCMECELAE